MKKFIIPILAMLLWQDAAAQSSLSLYYMDNVPQSSLLNPARRPRCNAYVSLVSTSFRFESNIKESELIQNTDGQWHTLIDNTFDYSKINHRFRNGARINTQLAVNVLNVGWRSARGYWSIGIAERINASTSLPSAIFSMLDKGFSNGTRLDFSSLRVNASVYREISAGYSINLTDQLSLGGRVKFLTGLASIKSDIAKFSITSGREQWDINMNGSLSASFPIKINDNDDGTIDIDSIEIKELSVGKWINKALIGIKNPGVAIDLGAEYTFNKNFKISAAATDLGMIFWADDANTIKSKCSYTFNGVEMDLDEFLDGTDFVDMISETADSIKNSLTTKVSQKPFLTGVNPNIYIGGEYTPLHFLSLGLVSQTTLWRGGVSQNFNLSANVKPYKFFGVTTGINIDVKGCCTANFGFSINLGPVQYYLMTNGLPIAYRKLSVDGDKLFVPYNVCDLSISTGLNLVFGSKGFKDKSMINTESEF